MYTATATTASNASVDSTFVPLRDFRLAFKARVRAAVRKEHPLFAARRFRGQTTDAARSAAATLLNSGRALRHDPYG